MKEKYKIILIVLLCIIVGFAMIACDMEVLWVQNIVPVIIGLVLCVFGGCIIFRCIKPKMKSHEIMKEDLKDIYSEYSSDTNSQAFIDYMYTRTVEFEKSRFFSKIFLFIVGLSSVLCGILTLKEVVI